MVDKKDDSPKTASDKVMLGAEEGKPNKFSQQASSAESNIKHYDRLTLKEEKLKGQPSWKS